MRIGWRALIKNKLRTKSDKYSIGIAVDQDAVTFCALKKEKEGNFSLFQETVVSSQNWGEQLAQWVAKHSLSGAQAHVAFSIAFYQQLQIDRPSVEDSELDNALKWSIDEMIGGQEPKAFDYFDLPVPLAGNKKINIIAINESAVKEAVEACYGSGLNLETISVEELVTCNISVDTDLPVLTLIQDSGDEVCLNIVKGGVLYFSRRLKGFENLSSFSAEELQMGIVDSLSVQVQRSMDYFESQLRQAPIRTIKIKLDTQHHDTLAAQIRQAVPAEIGVLKTGIDIPDELNEARLSYTAIGAALQSRVSASEDNAKKEEAA